MTPKGIAVPYRIWIVGGYGSLYGVIEAPAVGKYTRSGRMRYRATFHGIPEIDPRTLTARDMRLRRLQVPLDPAAIGAVLFPEGVPHVLRFGQDDPMMNGDDERAQEQHDGIQRAQH